MIPNHYPLVMGNIKAQIGKNNKPFGNGKGQIRARTEKRKGRMGNLKKVQNHKDDVSEESRDEMDVEKPKRCNEARH